MKALDLLKSTGDCNSFIGRPLPIKNTNASSKTDSSRHSSTSTQSTTPAGASHIPSTSSSKPATNRQVPPSKSGHLKSVKDFFQASPNKKHKHGISPTSPKLPALEVPLQNQWREGRTRNYTSEHLSQLQDPAPTYQRNLWRRDHLFDLDVEEIPDPAPTCNNFEDYLGFYNVLGADLSRTSTDEEISAAYDREKKSFRKNILQAHPDRNGGIDKGTQNITEK